MKRKRKLATMRREYRHALVYIAKRYKETESCFYKIASEKEAVDLKINRVKDLDNPISTIFAMLKLVSYAFDVPYKTVEKDFSKCFGNFDIPQAGLQ